MLFLFLDASIEANPTCAQKLGYKLKLLQVAFVNNIKSGIKPFVVSVGRFKFQIADLLVRVYFLQKKRAPITFLPTFGILNSAVFCVCPPTPPSP